MPFGALDTIGVESARELGRALATNWTLTALFIMNKSFSIADESIFELRRVLASNSTLPHGLMGTRSMLIENLGDTHICDEGARELGRALAANSTLKTMYLGDNSISDEGARDLDGARAGCQFDADGAVSPQPQHQLRSPCRASGAARNAHAILSDSAPEGMEQRH